MEYEKGSVSMLVTFPAICNTEFYLPACKDHFIIALDELFYREKKKLDINVYTAVF